MSIRKRLTLWLLFLFSFPTYANFTLNPQIHNNASLPLGKHHGSGRFDSYLSMEVNYAPVKALYEQLQKKVGPLNHRGEAHITVITPIEYYDVLSTVGISINEIDQIARNHHLQRSTFETVCVGRGVLKQENKALKTYYVVVESKDLVKIRKEIQKLFLKRGGNGNAFKADHFYPHITLGFTERDLHENDGVLKNRSSCWETLQ